MKFRKVYGQGGNKACPFCGQSGTTTNGQGIPVCHDHKTTDLVNLKCMCGDWLDVRAGKYGPYFNCMNCGNVKWDRGLEINPDISKHTHKEDKPVKKKPFQKKNSDGTEKEWFKKDDYDDGGGNKGISFIPGAKKKEIVITGDEVDFFG